MGDVKETNDFEKILAMKKDDLKKIYNQMDANEIENLLSLLNEVQKDDQE